MEVSWPDGENGSALETHFTGSSGSPMSISLQLKSWESMFKEVCCSKTRLWLGWEKEKVQCYIILSGVEVKLEFCTKCTIQRATFITVESWQCRGQKLNNWTTSGSFAKLILKGTRPQNHKHFIKRCWIQSMVLHVPHDTKYTPFFKMVSNCLTIWSIWLERNTQLNSH